VERKRAAVVADHLEGVLALLLMVAAPAGAPSVRHVWRTAPSLVRLPGLASERYQNAADIILEQAARNLPLHPGASSAFTYRWNADRDQLERSLPLRPETPSRVAL
jgi:hypothetical protein